MTQAETTLKESPAPAPGSRGQAIVVTPATAGGLGDQAMIDVATTALTNAGYSVTLAPNANVTRAPSSVVETEGIGGKISLIAALIRAQRVIVIGADMLDGVYGETAILKRLKLAKIAHQFGAKTRVIGSSFSSTPNDKVVGFLKSAPWLEILARETLSRDRMQTHLDRDIQLVADSAFLLKPEATCQEAENAIAFAESQKQHNRKVLALNVSGLVFSRIAPGALDGFIAAVTDWVQKTPDIAPIIVAHDRRPGAAGDLDACDALAAAMEQAVPERCHYLRDGISAWDAKAVARYFDMAFLCRMHFAIACLGQGVPPLSLVSMGKFEGLMEHFGLESLTLDPAVAASDPKAIHAALDALCKNADAYRTRIEQKLPDVRALSAKNYDGV